jgi:hypothetical protein
MHSAAAARLTDLTTAPAALITASVCGIVSRTSGSPDSGGSSPCRN